MMEVEIQVNGFSPPGIHTDIRVSASGEYHRMLGDLNGREGMQDEMIELLGQAVKQLCAVYQIDPADIKIGRVVDEPVKVPPKPEPVRHECVACGGKGTRYLFWICDACKGRGWVQR